MFQPLKMILSLLLFASSLLFLNISNAEKMIKKCCREGELLNLETKECFPKKEVENSLTFFPPELLDVKPGGVLSHVGNLIFKDESHLPSGFPSCTYNNNNNKNDLQILELDDKGGDYYLSTDGKLVSWRGKYELSRDLGDFCIDLAAANSYLANVSRVALVCDPCGSGSTGVACIKTCCPHTSGLAEYEGPDSEPSRKCIETRSALPHHF